MRLQDELDTLRAEELARTPPAVLEIENQALGLIRASGVASRALAEGDPAPDFALSDPDGQLVRLRDLLAKGPVILDFFRGGWCPFCSLELRAYQRLVHDIEASGASLIAVSPETPDHLRTVIGDYELSFPVLSDPGSEVARVYGIVYTVPEAMRSVYAAFGLDLPERNGSSSFELPVPATFLIDREGIVRRAFVDVDVTQRGEPVEFIAGLRELRAEG